MHSTINIVYVYIKHIINQLLKRQSNCKLLEIILMSIE